MYYGLILVNIILLVAGQTLWKLGIGHRELRSVGAVLEVMLSPWVIAGIALYAIATVISIYLLSKLPLSLLYPVQSLTYVVILFVAIFVFHEHVSVTRWIGVGVILLGVTLVVK